MGRKKIRTKESISQYHKTYYKNHAAVIAEQRRVLRVKLKTEVFMAYGGFQCVCPHGLGICGETEKDFLCIDHINGGGAKHRKEVGSGNSFCGWLKRNKFPEGFRVLCHNCNQARGYTGTCPKE